MGILYKKWGHDYSYMPPFADEFYPKQLKIYEKFYPQHIEFLIGVAKGLNIDKDIILKFSLTIFLSVSRKITETNCSIFGANNKNGVFIGRSYDWLESSELSSKFLQYDYTDKSSYSFKGISDMGTYKLGKKVGSNEYVLVTDDAWNDKIYIGLNGAPGNKGEVGISMPHVIQLIAEQCDSVNKSISVISKLPTCSSRIFTIADYKGNLSVIEKSLEGGIKIRKSKKYIIATNHFNHQDLVPLNALIFKKVPSHSTFARYHYLEADLTKNWQKLELEDIIPLLDKPPTLQNWRGVKKGDTITVWELALNLKDGKYHIVFAPLISDRKVIKN